jgi:thioredoxin-like negative regulator of GroEL
LQRSSYSHFYCRSSCKLLSTTLRRGKERSYTSTIEGDPLAYDGDRPVLIAIWASWASVWRAATEKFVDQLKGEFSDKCEFAYVECLGRPVQHAYRADVVPVLILRHRGKELARFVNTLEVEQVRQAIAACVA